MTTQTAGWHPEDIKAAIRKSGTTLAALARENGLSTSTLHQALRHRVRAGELVIARALKRKPGELWPDRWDAKGNRKRRRQTEQAELTGTANVQYNKR